MYNHRNAGGKSPGIQTALLQNTTWTGAWFSVNVEQIFLLLGQVQEFHTTERSNLGNTCSEQLFSSKQKCSVILFDINLQRGVRVYIYVRFFLRNSTAGCYSRRKINQRGKNNLQSTSFCESAPSVLLVTNTLLWDCRILSSLHEKCHHSVLGFFCLRFLIEITVNTGNFIVQIVVSVHYLRMCRSLRL